MSPRVTAIVVARQAGDHLEETLEALRNQTRPPDAVVGVDLSTGDAVAALFARFQATHIVGVHERQSFGTAIAAGCRALTPTGLTVGAASIGDDEWLWLLAQDTPPERTALEALFNAAETSPSVAVAGPKIVAAEDPALIRDFGVAMTRFGATTPLVADEMDQAQHDGLSDVLGVHPPGMLIRHAVLHATGGFDPALPVIDDGLDLCVRVRLAGYRVVLVPGARVRIHGDGIAGPKRPRRSVGHRRLFRLRRTAQLHRRMAYAPAWAVPLHWLSLLPLAILRSAGRILAKEPGAVVGELAAALRVAFSAVRISAARARLRASRRERWSTIAPLRVPSIDVRRARAARREAYEAAHPSATREIDFFGTGGAWVLLVLIATGVAISLPIIGAHILVGGGLLPLSSTPAELWAQVGYGWRDIGGGFVGAADPFTSVLAVLGSLTFWQPSYSIALLWILALPLSGLGMWLFAARISERPGVRAFAAIGWALAPMLLVALQDGRPAAVLSHVLIGWMFLAGVSASRSVAASATTALLGAAVVATSPSLAPALVLVWVGAMVVARKRFARLVLIPAPAVALFLPLAISAFARGKVLDLLADPGLPVPATASRGWQLAAGFPESSLGGWYPLAAQLGIAEAPPSVVIAVLLAPIAGLAVLGVFLRGSLRVALALAVALVGFVSAVLTTALQLEVTQTGPVGIWAGGSLSLYWIGLITAAALAVDAIHRAAGVVVGVTLAALAVVVAPAGLAQLTGRADVYASSGRTLPAVVAAGAAAAPRGGTLVLTPQSDGALGATLVRGAGLTLDDQSTLYSTRVRLTGADRDLATLAGNLASQSGKNLAPDLTHLGIRYVLLAPTAGGTHATEAASALSARASTAMDGNALLTPVGDPGAGGTLWSVPSTPAKVAPAARIPANAGGAWRTLTLLLQALVFGIAVLAALPFGRRDWSMRPVAVSAGVTRDEEMFPAAEGSAPRATSSAGSQSIDRATTGGSRDAPIDRATSDGSHSARIETRGAVADDAHGAPIDAAEPEPPASTWADDDDIEATVIRPSRRDDVVARAGSGDTSGS